ncbi:MAG: hypothetical protein QOG31_1085, partial [Thermoplasmata archaeon]|nr:hypothetical protein [Thermoplasmata archaeon]
MMKTNASAPASGRKTASFLAVGLFVASAIAILPATDARTIDPRTLVDTVWALVCNPINPAANEAAPTGPSAPSQPLSTGNAQVQDCQNLNDVLDYAHGVLDSPCGSHACLANCPPGQTGYYVDGKNACVRLGYSGFCNSPQVGVIGDGLSVCYTPGYTGPCGNGQTGYYVDGENGCVTLRYTGLCSNPEIGVIVDGVSACVSPPSSCPSGKYGVPPECATPPPSCPSGYVGMGPWCASPGTGGSCSSTVNLVVGCAYAGVEGGVVGLGVGPFAGAGAGASPDAESLALDTGLASMTCNGYPILSVACAGSAAAKVHVCAEVQGDSWFGSISAKACADGGGAATALATMSLAREWEAAVADAAGHSTVVVRDHYQCDRPLADKGSRACHWVYREDHQVESHHGQCFSDNFWAMQSVHNAIADPL